MDLTLTEEDKLLFELALEVAAKLRPGTPAREPAEPDSTGWRELTQLGLLGLGTPEGANGAGGTWVQAGLAVQGLARSACDQPYVGCGILAPALLAAAAGNEPLIAALTSGQRRIGVGLSPDLAGIARAGVDPYAVGFDCAGADAIVVLAAGTPPTLALASPGERADSVDISAVLQRAELGPGAELSPAGELSQSGLERWEARALVTVAADLVGVMEAAASAAAEHAKVRVQFGKPIGSFQAIQHLVADQYVSCDAALWAVRYAAWCLDHDPDNALLAARTAKAYVSAVARPVCETTIQVLGGMGFLWESWAHVYLRRAILGAAVLGGHEHQAGLIGELRRRRHDRLP